MAPMGTSRVYRPDPSRIGDYEQWGAALAGATFTTNQVVVTVRGEIDAINGPALARCVERQVAIDGTLVLELSAVEFFGTAGLIALPPIDLCCAGTGWMLVASASVRRVLRVCRGDDLPLTG